MSMNTKKKLIDGYRCCKCDRFFIEPIWFTTAKSPTMENDNNTFKRCPYCKADDEYIDSDRITLDEYIKEREEYE